MRFLKVTNDGIGGLDGDRDYRLFIQPVTLGFGLDPGVRVTPLGSGSECCNLISANSKSQHFGVLFPPPGPVVALHPTLKYPTLARVVVILAGYISGCPAPAGYFGYREAELAVLGLSLVRKLKPTARENS